MSQEKMESGISAESRVEQKEKEKPRGTKIIFQRHSEFNSEASNECYWRRRREGEINQVFN